MLSCWMQSSQRSIQQKCGPARLTAFMRRPKRDAVRLRSTGRHAQSAVGVGTQEDAAPTSVAGQKPLIERNSGSFRFWIDERRFKGRADKCLVQEALFAAGGVRTGGYPKAAPVPGPLGWQRSSDWDMLWSPARSAIKAVPHLKPGQLVSAVPGLYSLTKKRRLSHTLSTAYGDASAWQLVPQSYSLPAELPKWRAWLDQQAAAGVDPGPWMLKTAQHLGKGLVLLPGELAYNQALKIKAPSGKPFVLAQRYVSDPLLINGCKFGLRLWLLVMGTDPFTSYLHKQGLVLFSTDSYDIGSLSDDDGSAGRGHITNYAQNVNGTVWSLARLKEHLGTEAWRGLWAQLVSSAAQVACAAMGDVRQEHRALAAPPNSTFELLGLDYLVDAELRPWLLEVNGTPSLAVDHGDTAVEQVIRDTKRAMVRDMVGILNCRSRFLVRYGLQRPGVKLASEAARRLLASVQRDDPLVARKRVEAELRHRGGFLPLMGHYPVLRFKSNSTAGSSRSSSSSSEVVDRGGLGLSQDAAKGQLNDESAAERTSAAAADGRQAAGSSNLDDDEDGSGDSSQCSADAVAPGGLVFSDRDQQLWMYMQGWWRKQRKLIAAKKKLRDQQIVQA